MIVLDTNVVSELMREIPNARVLAWADSQVAEELHLTSMTSAELLSGVARLPEGRRRERLSRQVGRLVDEVFDGRVIPFDLSASVDYARIVQARDRAGSPISVADAVIAATVVAAGADALATRNVRDFVGTGLRIVNPWET
ncbi:type II toxin-antitoxin system VapC family toxin [Curtobacterium ammoniigenes]|uniref:type II toxin-antitoxin system VapC family toxin n=1 Tax=Curtobacterium ammoniigenes TaxID=395387 RepID=UPI00083750BF|nr:type II toxin-antitoxin system VapC family toxin [Curtobacterium ammoniigenes]